MMSNKAEQIVEGRTEPDVEGLVRKAQTGDMGAFDELVRTFQKPMFNLAYRMVHNPDDAADLTQEIFVKLYRSIGKFHGRSKFTTWLYVLAANTCRSGLRKIIRVSSREVASLDEEREGEEGFRRNEPVDETDLPGAGMERSEKMRKIEEIIADLPEDFRMVIVLRDMQELSYEEVAEALDCSVGTVKSRLARARSKLKDRFTREGLTCSVTI